MQRNIINQRRHRPLPAYLKLQNRFPIHSLILHMILHLSQGAAAEDHQAERLEVVVVELAQPQDLIESGDILVFDN